jgi:hypothetical protein
VGCRGLGLTSGSILNLQSSILVLVLSPQHSVLITCFIDPDSMVI